MDWFDLLAVQGTLKSLLQSCVVLIIFILISPVGKLRPRVVKSLGPSHTAGNQALRLARAVPHCLSEPRVAGRWSWGRWRSAARIGWTRVRCPLQSSAPRTAAPSFQRRLSPFEGSSSRDCLQIFVNMFLPGSHGTNNSFLFSFCQKKRM